MAPAFAPNGHRLILLACPIVIVQPENPYRKRILAEQAAAAAHH